MFLSQQVNAERLKIIEEIEELGRALRESGECSEWLKGADAGVAQASGILFRTFACFSFCAAVLLLGVEGGKWPFNGAASPGHRLS